MPYSRKIVLHTPNGLSGRVEEVARQFIADGVVFVACVGQDCDAVEDLVDWVAVEAGSPERNFILTSSHSSESLEDVIEFAASLTGEYAGGVEVVEL
jgi:hypothetical protein